MTQGWRAKIGGGYFGVETLLGYVAATMFSEDGLNTWFGSRQVQGAVMGMFEAMMGVW